MVLCTTTTTTTNTTTTMCQKNKAVDEVIEVDEVDEVDEDLTKHYEALFAMLPPVVKDFVHKFGRRDGNVRETLTTAIVAWALHVTLLHAKNSELEEFKYSQQRDGAKGDKGKPSDEGTDTARLLEKVSTERFKRHRDIINEHSVLQATKKAKGAPHTSSSHGEAQAPEHGDGSGAGGATS